MLAYVSWEEMDYELGYYFYNVEMQETIGALKKGDKFSTLEFFLPRDGNVLNGYCKLIGHSTIITQTVKLVATDL